MTARTLREIVAGGLDSVLSVLFAAAIARPVASDVQRIEVAARRRSIGVRER